MDPISWPWQSEIRISTEKRSLFWVSECIEAAAKRSSSFCGKLEATSQFSFESLPLDARIKDTDFFPTRSILIHELLVPLRRRVLVEIGFGLEHQMQSHIPLAVVEHALFAGQRA